ncbi:MAG: DUF2510 domain-containing protein [Actinomycetes bacterium]
MRRGGRVGTWAQGAVVVGVLLLVTSCRAVETTVEVREDRTATVSLLVVPGPRYLKEFGGETPFLRLIRQFDNPDAGVAAKKVVEPGGVGMLVTVEVDSLSELSQPVALRSPPAPAGATLQLFDSFTLVRRSGTWRLDAVARPVTALVAGVPDLEGRLEDSRYDVSVRLPGTVEATNGTESGNGATWGLTGTSGTRRLLLRNAESAPLSPLFLVVGGAVVLILVGLLFAARGTDAARASKIRKDSSRFLRRRKEEQASWQAAAGSTLPPGPAAQPGADPNDEPSPVAAAPTVLYAEDHVGDDSLALPSPATGWGPAPAPGTTTTGTVRPAPRPVPTSGDGAAAMGPADPVVALDRGSRLGVAKEEPTAAALPPPGWYADPEDPTRQRFWDGVGWTEHRS